MTSTSTKRANSISSDEQPSTATDNVLEVEGLQTIFHTQDGKIHAVNDVSFSLEAGELLGIVGESGSGKSVTMMSLLKLLPMPPAEIVAGKVMSGTAVKLSEAATLNGTKLGLKFDAKAKKLHVGDGTVVAADVEAKNGVIHVVDSVLLPK